MALCRIHPKEENKEVKNDYPAAHDCKRRWIHAARSTLFNQAYEVRDGNSGEDVAMVTVTGTEQEIASQLVPLLGRVDDRSTGTTISSTSGDGCFIDSEPLKWADRMISTPPSSQASVPSSNQPIDVLMSAESGNLSEAEILEWTDSLLAADDGMVAQPTPFATGSSFATEDGSSDEDVATVTATCTGQEIAAQLVPPPGRIDDRSTNTTISSTSGDGWFIDSDTLKWADSLIPTPPSSPISLPSSSQPIEELMPSDRGIPSVADVLAWIESSLAADDGMEVQPP